MSALAAAVAVTVYPSSGRAGYRGLMELHYDPRDPWALRLRVGAVEWVVARDLLADGLTARAGVGDVSVGPLPGGLLGIELTDATRGEARARLLAGSGEVSRLLAATYQLVPHGQEARWVDFDQLTTWLMAAANMRRRSLSPKNQPAPEHGDSEAGGESS